MTGPFQYPVKLTGAKREHVGRTQSLVNGFPGQFEGCQHFSGLGRDPQACQFQAQFLGQFAGIVGDENHPSTSLAERCHQFDGTGEQGLSRPDGTVKVEREPLHVSETQTHARALKRLGNDSSGDGLNEGSLMNLPVSFHAASTYYDRNDRPSEVPQLTQAVFL